MGVKNAMPVDREVLEFYVTTLKALAPDATWTGAGIGKDQLTLNRWSLELGGHCRTGLEDNVRGQGAGGGGHRPPAPTGGTVQRRERTAGGQRRRGPPAGCPGGLDGGDGGRVPPPEEGGAEAAGGGGEGGDERPTGRRRPPPPPAIRATGRTPRPPAQQNW